MATSSLASQFSRRRVRLALMNGRAVEGNIHVSESQSLTVFLSTRRYYASLTEAAWAADPEDTLPHVAIRVDQILWAQPQAVGLHVSTAQPATAQPRRAEVVMDDGTVLRASLFIAEDQRMTDYIDSAFGFLPVHAARALPDGGDLGRITLNVSRVLSIRELAEEDA